MGSSLPQRSEAAYWSSPMDSLGLDRAVRRLNPGAEPTSSSFEPTEGIEASATREDQACLSQALELIQAGKLEAAEVIYRELIHQASKNPTVYINLAYICSQSGRGAEEITLLKQAILLRPDHAEALFSLADALLQQGDLAASIDWFRAALCLAPHDGEAHFNLGLALHQQGDLDGAVESYEKALQIHPDDPECHFSLGLVLQQKGLLNAAITSYQRAVFYLPSHAEALYNLGHALRENGDLEAAIEAFSKLLSVHPHHADGLVSLGVVWRQCGESERARAAFEQVLAFQPDHPLAQFNLSLGLLRAGNYARGWEMYESRDLSVDNMFPELISSRPTWSPGLGAVDLLLWPEQGVGDLLLFCSLLEDARALAHRLIVQSDPRLLPLLRRSIAGISFIDYRQPVSEATYAAQLPIGGLGRYLRGASGDFPADRKRYLRCDHQRSDQLRDHLRSSLGPEDEMLCGIAWRSFRADKQLADQKSIPLQALATAIARPGVRLVSLQYGPVEDEIRALQANTGIEVLSLQSIDRLNDLDGLACLIDVCDRVVTTSNTTAHLAGALGAPTWVLLPMQPLWYWGIDAEITPWYPSLRLLRQRRRGDWAEPLERLSWELGQTRGPAAFGPQASA